MSEDQRDGKGGEERMAQSPSARFSRDEGGPEVEGHIRASGAERVVGQAERVAARDEEPEVEGHLFVTGNDPEGKRARQGEVEGKRS